MHAHILTTVAGPLTGFYAVAAAVNLVAAWRSGRKRRWMTMGAWIMVAVVFGLLGGLAWSGHPLEVSERLKTAVDWLIGPVTFTLGSLATLIACYLGRRWLARPAVAWSGLNVSLLVLGASMTDVNFASVVLRPDNVPIVGLVYLLAFFTWLAASQAIANDDRIGRGEEPAEKELSDTALVWPDLVYVELIAMVLLAAGLIVWSLLLRAPLEPPANPAVTPNPSKAPWYFVGLQEMLVYFDPSVAGVIVPCLIILGLMAIPYLDFNPRGSGYYTIRQRKFAYLAFQFGFLQLWISLILIGTFMRGPNWSFFGPYEFRDPSKVAAITNVKLSEYFWVTWLGRGLPQAAAGAGCLVQGVTILWREIAGVVALGAYFGLLPWLLGKTILQRFRSRMTFGRYAILSLLLLMMLAVPLKMILRWQWNLSYLVSIPEYLFNF